MRALVYDIETKKRVLGKNEQAFEGEQVALSWMDRTDMGISVICAVTYPDKQHYVFRDNELPEFIQLALSCDVLSGYGIKTFDNLMLKAHGYDMDFIRTYDLMHELRCINTSGKIQSLNTMLARQGFPLKAMDGAHAPYLYQTGQWDALVGYCLDDCNKELLLFEKAAAQVPWNTETSVLMPRSPWEIPA